ncbi:unnamed protein product [Boreogadus saida]
MSLPLNPRQSRSSSPEGGDRAGMILGVIEKTITDYEDQASHLKREADRQRNLLDIVLRPKLPENVPFQPAATNAQQPEPGFMCQPLPVRNPSGSSEPLCAFTSREEFLKFASVGYCPYCCKATEASEIHLIKRHYLFAIHYTDKDVERFTVPCTCKERIKGRSHWHCPDCGKTIYRKNNFEMHLSKQHGHLLLQQSQDPEAFQAFAPFGEEDGPPEEWLWPGFNGLDQEGGEEEPPAPPRIKEEQEPLWIGLEGGRELTVPPAWPCRTPQEELEKLQVKKEEEERHEWGCEEEEEEEEEAAGGPRHGPHDSMATAGHVKAFHRDLALTSSSSSSFGNTPSEVESGQRDAFATTSSMLPQVDAHLGGGSTGMMELAHAWPQPHDDGSLGSYKDPTGGQREGGGEWLGVKPPRPKRARHGKTNGSHAGFRWRRPGRFSPFQSPRGPHRCKLCGKAFYCVLTLLKHAQTHAQDAGCVCVVCGKHSESKEGLLQHLQTHKENFKTF